MLVFWSAISLMLLAALSIFVIPLLAHSQDSNQKLNYTIIFSILIVLLTSALIMYLNIGASSELRNQFLTEQKVSELRGKIGSVPDAIVMLQKKMQENPNDARGWFLLGSLYLKAGNSHEAVKVLSRANNLEPQQTGIMSLYAEAIYLDNHRKFHAQLRKLMQAVLAIEPNNMGIMNLMAMDAYQQKNYQKAIDIWQELLPRLPANSNEITLLSTMIDKAKNQLISL
jgi:cytochrome c-type biogenesis protein CcmH